MDYAGAFRHESVERILEAHTEPESRRLRPSFFAEHGIHKEHRELFKAWFEREAGRFKARPSCARWACRWTP